MNRKQRRELRKDKNLIIELYSIIKKYLPKLLDKFEALTDTCIKNISDICDTNLKKTPILGNYTRCFREY